jgi:hypothetical protein
MNLNYWLRKTPRPVVVLAVCDGVEKRIEVPKNARAWKDLAATIKSLQPSRLTCLGPKDDVIRAVDLESENEEEDKPTPSVEMSDVQLFAKLIAEAYDKASGKMQPIVDSAMAFVERGGTRLAKAEAENDRLRAQIHKLHLQIAELTGQPAAQPEESILATMVAGVIAGQQAQPPLQAVPKQGAKK